ncbi:efflux RND transporter periplasmic adaptor subunit [Alishewanella longhuensis]
MKNILLFSLLTLPALLLTSAIAGEGHKHEQTHDKHPKITSDTQAQAHAHGHEHSHTAGHNDAAGKQVEGHDDVAVIAAAMAEQVGIRVVAAAAGTIERHIPLYGELVTPPNRQAQVRARFPGMITQINVTVGQRVKRGDVLALVESNDSLRTYPLKAPIAGIVLQQFASQGEYTAGESLFAITDPSELWAELKVFPAVLDDIKSGLPVHIEARNGRYDSTISHILPASGQPYVYARVTLDNSSGRFAIGERLSALVDAEIMQVALVIDNLAVQEFAGQAVVFVQNGEQYRPRAVQLGRTDGRFTEVLAGLKAGERYVVANSYLIKAELEKSAAAHEH